MKLLPSSFTHLPVASTPKPFDFFSPDTFTYVSLDVAADGVLSVAVKGIDSYSQNSFPEPAAAGQSRTILSFSLDPNPVASVVAWAQAERAW
jgi:hypothetical protein